jgi:hypothetical protein
MPSDAWLNAELRERGCPDAMLERWRKRMCSCLVTERHLEQ